MIARRHWLAGFAALALAPSAGAQNKPSSRPGAAPAVSAARSIMAGAPLSVFLTRPPQGARLAIARPDDPATSAIVVVEPKNMVPTLPTPGIAGAYELRLTVEKDGAPVILLRQPLVTTEPEATIAAPDKVGRGQHLPVRGIGPNGELDRVVLVAPDAPVEAEGPRFFPAENVEATLEVPDEPGLYELRYLLNAPVSGLRILARRPLRVE